VLLTSFPAWDAFRLAVKRAALDLPLIEDDRVGGPRRRQ
jgi:hypothetical protein